VVHPEEVVGIVFLLHTRKAIIILSVGRRDARLTLVVHHEVGVFGMIAANHRAAQCLSELFLLFSFLAFDPRDSAPALCRAHATIRMRK
jgi:hypothetical protein